jgi:hypothetical protein
MAKAAKAVKTEGGVVDIFGGAKTVAPAPKAKLGSKKRQVPITGMEAYAALDAAIKTIETLHETTGAIIKDQMAAEFVEDGVAGKRRPENFTGTERRASASCELRKRGSNSPLKPHEVELMRAFGIPIEEKTDVDETFIINPAYAADAVLLEKVSRALSKVDGLPMDFIQKQVPEVKYVTTEDSLDVLFKKERAVVDQCLRVAGTLAIKANLNEAKVSAAFKKVLELVEATEQTEH